MKIEQFEKELKELDSSFRVVPHPSNPTMAGVYLGSLYVCGIPGGEIFNEVRPDYKNEHGHVHKTREQALAQIGHYLWRIKNEPGFLETESEIINESSET